jgi:hypothetical protein
MKNTRCEEVIVQLIVRTYDATGRPIAEHNTQPGKVFRNAETRDFWGAIDKQVDQMVKQLNPPPPPPAAPASKGKGAKAK